MVLLVVHARAGPDAGTAAGTYPFGRLVPASAPFAAFSRSTVAVGDRCRAVLVATSHAQRVQGLRDVRSIDPYAGMVFVFAGDTSGAFTMAATRLPLDIVFYASDGTPVDRARMTPCPAGTDATCPAYRSRHEYRFALETPAGAAAAGALGSCG